MKYIFLVAAILTVTIGVAALTLQNRPSEGDGIIVTPEQIHFGDIEKNGGIVTAIVVISNTSNEDITINRLSTSCGCTEAMMDLSPLTPNEKRELTITFDPMVHEDQLGEIIRVVYLQTSDTEHPEIEIDITGTVIE